MSAKHSAFTAALVAPYDHASSLVRFHLARARVSINAAERFAGIPCVCRNHIADARAHMAAAYAEHATNADDARAFARLLDSRAKSARNAGMLAFADRIEALRDSYLIRASVFAHFPE